MREDGCCEFVDECCFFFLYVCWCVVCECGEECGEEGCEFCVLGEFGEFGGGEGEGLEVGGERHWCACVVSVW